MTRNKIGKAIKDNMLRKDSFGTNQPKIVNRDTGTAREHQVWGGPEQEEDLGLALWRLRLSSFHSWPQSQLHPRPRPTPLHPLHSACNACGPILMAWKADRNMQGSQFKGPRTQRQPNWSLTLKGKRTGISHLLSSTEQPTPREGLSNPGKGIGLWYKRAQERWWERMNEKVAEWDPERTKRNSITKYNFRNTLQKNEAEKKIQLWPKLEFAQNELE